MTDRQRLRKIELAASDDVPSLDDWRWLMMRAKCHLEAEKAIKKVASLVWRWMGWGRVRAYELYDIITDYRAQVKSLKAKWGQANE